MRPVLGIVSILLLAVSCVDSIVLDPHEELPVVVYCVLEESDEQALELYYAKGKSQSSYEPVKEADIVVYKGEDAIARFGQESGTGKWKASFRPECGETYRLEIGIPGQELITAQTRMPDDFDVFCFYGPAGYLKNKDHYTPALSYELRILSRRFGYEDTYGRIFDKDCNLWVFPLHQLSHVPGHKRYNEYIATDHLGSDDFNVSGLHLSELDCFSDDAIYSLPSLIRPQLRWFLQYCSDLPVHRRFVRIYQAADYDNGKRKTDEDTPLYSEKSFVLATDFVTDYSAPINHPELGPNPIDEIRFEFYSVSPELDLYLKELSHRDIGTDEMLSQYRSDNLYSNIDGGLGIFGSRILRINREAMRGYNH